MKKHILLIFVLLAVIFSACTPATPPAGNFAFVFQESPCGYGGVFTLDSAKGILTYDPMDGTAAMRVDLQLTKAELGKIYSRAALIDFFHYPTVFTISTTYAGYEKSPISYQLALTNGNQTNSVQWMDNVVTRFPNDEADQLRGLMKLIDKSMRKHEEFKKLPELKGRCF